MKKSIFLFLVTVIFGYLIIKVPIKLILKKKLSIEPSLVLYLYDYATNKPIKKSTVLIDGKYFENNCGYIKLFNFDPHSIIDIKADGYHRVNAKVSHLSKKEYILSMFPEMPFKIFCLDKETRKPLIGVKIYLNYLNKAPEIKITDINGCVEYNSIDIQAYDKDGIFSYVVNLKIESDDYLKKVIDVDYINPTLVFLEKKILLTVHTVNSEDETSIPFSRAIIQWDTPEIIRANSNVEIYYGDVNGVIQLPLPNDVRGIELLVYHEDYAFSGLVKRPTNNDEFKYVEVKMEKGYEVVGVVFDDNGNPIKNVLVDFDPTDRPDFTNWMRGSCHKYFSLIPDIVSTNDEGLFELKNISKGEYKIVLIHDDYYPNPMNPPITVGLDSKMWVGEVCRGITFEGTVVTDSGVGIPDVPIMMIREDENGKAIKGFAKIFKTDNLGLFKFKGLTDNVYKMIVIGGLLYNDQLFEINPLFASRRITLTKKM